MNKAWLPLFFLLFCSSLFVVAALRISLNTSSAHTKRKDLVALTGLSEIAWRTAWYEPRIRRYQLPSYDPYPEMPPINRLGNIYRLKPMQQMKKIGKNYAD